MSRCSAIIPPFPLLLRTFFPPPPLGEPPRNQGKSRGRMPVKVSVIALFFFFFFPRKSPPSPPFPHYSGGGCKRKKKRAKEGERRPFPPLPLPRSPLPLPRAINERMGKKYGVSRTSIFRSPPPPFPKNFSPPLSLLCKRRSKGSSSCSEA